MEDRLTFLANVVRHWFAQPQALWLLGLVPLLGLLVGLARRRRRKALARWGYGPGLGAGGAGGVWRWLRGTARALGLALLIVGIAGPRWGRVDSPATVTGRDVVVVLDLSRSMLAQDVLGRSAPNRLGRAKDGVLDLADAVQRRGGHRLALVAFAARAQVVCPLTHDYDHFRDALRALEADDPLLEIGPGPEAAANGKPVSGTRIGRGLREAVRARDERFPGHQDIILVSDGDDPARDLEWREGIAAARAQGIPVHTVGVGDPDRDSPIPGADGPLRFQGKPVRTRLREPVLEEIARQTGGTYTPARTRALPLGEIFQERIEPRAGRADEDDLLPVYRQRSAWFFGLGLFWLAAEMALGDFRRTRRGRWATLAAS